MPIYYDFEEWELTDQDVERFGLWVCNYKETIPPWKPLNLYHWQVMCQHGLEYGAEVIQVPGSRGWDLRQKDGYQYAAVVVPDEEQQKQREPIYRKLLPQWMEDFDAKYSELYKPVMECNERLKQVDVESVSDIERVQHWEEAWLNYHRMWEAHMPPLFALGCIYGLFLDQLQELLGVDDHDERVKRVLGGFDNAVFRANQEVWRLARRAIDLGVGGLFESLKEDEVSPELEQSEAGRKWLDEYRQFLWQHGWRTERRMDMSTPTWVEKPSLGLRDIKIAVAQGGDFALARERERLARGREEAEKELLSAVPEGQRELFKTLTKVAQKYSWWSEDHTYYLDFYASALVRRATMAMGKMFARSGVIDDAEDIFFLLPDDIMKASIAQRRAPMHTVVEKRRKAWEENLNIMPPPFFGDFEVLTSWVMSDPAFRVIAAPPRVRPELKADFYGSGAAAGVVEGPARVMLTVDRIAELQPGEILVTASTTAPWMPAFSVAKGVITEAGGNLTHAVIISREYGIPCVAGCMEATGKIKTGQRVRVDGDNCAVYILE